MKIRELYNLFEYSKSPANVGDHAAAIYRLQDIENFADSLFNRLGIDIEFTRHFKQRLKRLCFNEDVPGRLTAGDLKDLFENAFRKYANKIKKKAQATPNMEGIFSDLSRILHIPFAVEYDPDAALPISIINKTISGKKGFKSYDEFFFV